jgi:hypothetical protein
MNVITRWNDYWDWQVRRFGIFEIKMAQGGAMAVAFIIAKLFPQIVTLSVWWFVAPLVVCAVPLHYALWFKKAG